VTELVIHHVEQSVTKLVREGRLHCGIRLIAQDVDAELFRLPDPEHILAVRPFRPRQHADRYAMPEELEARRDAGVHRLTDCRSAES